MPNDSQGALGAEEFAGLLRGCMSTAVRLAITRHNLELDPDAASEEDIADDAAGACFGEECCDDKPISEVVQLLAYAQSLQQAAAPTGKCGLPHSLPTVYHPCCLAKGHNPEDMHLFMPIQVSETYYCTPAPQPVADPSKEELKAAPIADVVLNYRPKSKQPKPRKRKKAKRVRMRAV